MKISSQNGTLYARRAHQFQQHVDHIYTIPSPPAATIQYARPIIISLAGPS